MKVTSLTFYPVKSLGPVPVQELFFDAIGPMNDRNWMLVDENGRFVSQREIPKLCLIQPLWQKTLVSLKHKDNVFVLPEFHSETTATVWTETVSVFASSGEETAWFQKVVGQPLRLVKLKEARVPSHGISIRLSDSMPVLLCNEKSLASVNEQLESPVEMNRFRPNVVVGGTSAFEEDQWQEIQIGAVVFQKEKLCSRCSIITVDPLTGNRGHEPLKTLAQSRKQDGKIKFGIYCSVKKEGLIRVGDELKAKLL